MLGKKTEESLWNRAYIYSLVIILFIHIKYDNSEESVSSHRSYSNKICLFYFLGEFHSQSISYCVKALKNVVTEFFNKMTNVARFPKLDDYAHFHYEHVNLENLEICVLDEAEELGNHCYCLQVKSGVVSWTIHRSQESLVAFDTQLHCCIFDRQYSRLINLSELDKLGFELLGKYFQRFSKLNHDGLNCGALLNWLEIDNRSQRVLGTDSESCLVNRTAVASAYVVKSYGAQAPDELSLKVGDIIHVIDIPPAEESSWWRGKLNFSVGLFPSECVAVIGENLPRTLAAVCPGAAITVDSPKLKPVLQNRGKIVAFLRSFSVSCAEPRIKLKKSGILKERVFGCDLSEHLLNTGAAVPRVLSFCVSFIEKHCLEEGVYRKTGLFSNIHRLRLAFDDFVNEETTDLITDESWLQDIHCVPSLLKMYFRDLPNPLCTHYLYLSFMAAMRSNTYEETLQRMIDVVRKLPPPHYKTLENLIKHLVRVAVHSGKTGMTVENLATVWGPNIIRDRESEKNFSFQYLKSQQDTTAFLINNAQLIFDASSRIISHDVISGSSKRERPKFLPIFKDSQKLIDEDPGPKGLQSYHSVIEVSQPPRLQSPKWINIFRGKVVEGEVEDEAVDIAINHLTIKPEMSFNNFMRPSKLAENSDEEIESMPFNFNEELTNNNTVQLELRKFFSHPKLRSIHSQELETPSREVLKTIPVIGCEVGSRPINQSKTEVEFEKDKFNGTFKVFEGIPIN